MRNVSGAFWAVLYSAVLGAWPSLLTCLPAPPDLSPGQLNLWMRAERSHPRILVVGSSVSATVRVPEPDAATLSLYGGANGLTLAFARKALDTFHPSLMVLAVLPYTLAQRYTDTDWSDRLGETLPTGRIQRIRRLGADYRMAWSAWFRAPVEWTRERGLAIGLDEWYATAALDPTAVRAVQDFAAHAAQEQCRVIVYLSPHNPAMWDADQRARYDTLAAQLPPDWLNLVDALGPHHFHDALHFGDEGGAIIGRALLKHVAAPSPIAGIQLHG